jgi:hypothetical protein
MLFAAWLVALEWNVGLGARSKDVACDSPLATYLIGVCVLRAAPRAWA